MNVSKKFKVFASMVLVGVLVTVNAVGAQAYDGKKAADYAKKHAENYNSNYPDFDKDGGDCTNFASQCVFAGGIAKDPVPTKNIKYSHINDIYKTKDYWNSAKYTRTTTLFGWTVRSKTGFVTTSTWSVVSKNDSDSWWGFYNYMKNEGASAKEYSVDTVAKLNTFIAACDVGDVLQIRSGTNVNKWHSVIVTDKSYDYTNKRYDMKIAYHTSNTPPTDFRSSRWRAFGTDSLWTIIKVSKI